MREIKFRQFDKDCNIMEYWDLHENLDDKFWQNHALFQYPIMQYTGLKDKNGKEIYEGDILNSMNDNPEYDIWTYKDHKNLIVKWSEMYASFNGLPDYDYNSVYSFEHIEIIGNIYENPELLET